MKSSDPMAGKSIKTFKRFALADDDADDAELFAEALAAINPGILCEHAPNGKILLNKISNQKADLPDIIFLDINMPEMNGWDSLTELKRNSSLRNIPVVMYSTSSTHRDKQEAKKLGANFFYTKPDTFGQLKLFLENLIENPGEYNINH
jgi:CheY-like chemotaxis protein